ncbi:5'-AMP-activated protein kinase subunit beta-2 isoform X1 [Sorex fumeus]|uniref:5'-AMP-activated protein kinase subunit beta-2 isoform X1 n=1 Tax=Sorex fumeus TaxID=62283 RepID=UPI0024AD903A|nr:5'-AMP-activated protein kinase subunit beta-2 isoform X1 [Sorex fumeus]
MGNTASERAGERHGRAARAEGAGGAGPAKEHRILVGSTDDPGVFSLPDAKLPEDVSWQQDLEDAVKPSQQARPTVIRWSEGGKEVFISGSFNNWSAKIPLIKSHNDFVAILDLPEGEHQYKFFVDGQWVHDPSEPVVTSQLGTINNLIHVKKSDFEVFDALKLDSMESSETSCRGQRDGAERDPSLQEEVCHDSAVQAHLRGPWPASRDSRPAPSWPFCTTSVSTETGELMRLEAHACVSEPPSSGFRFCTWLQMRALSVWNSFQKKKIFPYERKVTGSLLALCVLSPWTCFEGAAGSVFFFLRVDEAQTSRILSGGGFGRLLGRAGD